MALKDIYAPSLKRRIKFGRLPSKGALKLPHLHDLVSLKSLPTPPSSCDYTSKALPALHAMYENDALGDCVIAGGYHVLGTETGNADGGPPFVATDAQIVSDYSSIAGYIPGNASTDNGTTLEAAIAYWMKYGFAGGFTLAGAVKVNMADPKMVALAIWLFENVYVGGCLPDAWVQNMPTGDFSVVWDAATPDPNNGHCWMSSSYHPDGSIDAVTWGTLLEMTQKAQAEVLVPANGGEGYALITPAMLSKASQKAPNGCDWAGLVAAFDALGGGLPQPPAPPPPPPPAPIPDPGPAPAPGAVTLQQAQAWATAGIMAGDPLQTQEQAAQAAVTGLAKGWPQ
jgi:hypothetical protein